MGLLLVLVQVALVVLNYGARMISVSPWVVFLPAILLATCYVLGALMGWTFMLDSFTAPYHQNRKRRK